MEGEPGLSMKDIGIEEDEQEQPIQDTVELPDNDSGGETDSGSSGSGTEGAGSMVSQSEMAKKSTVQKSSSMSKPAIPRQSGGNGESILKNFGDLAKGIEEESGLGNFSK
ncbi:MAG: hypothetical protein M1324_02730 [Patescibacteria group bacterium]|nr:hypothetical protein [Patescibacteria group bacterium]